MLRLLQIKSKLPKAILPHYFEVYPEHDNEYDFDRVVDTWMGVKVHEDVVDNLEKLIEIIKNS